MNFKIFYFGQEKKQLEQFAPIRQDDRKSRKFYAVSYKKN